MNPGFEKIFGYTKEELSAIGSFAGIIHEDDLQKVRENYYKRIIGENPTDQYTFRGITKEGALIHLEVIVSRLFYHDKPAVIGTLVDITDRVEEEMRISKAVNQAQEKERMQIGMELHDNVKQMLVGSLMNIHQVKQSLHNKDSAIETLNYLECSTKEAIDELRRLSHQLAPTINAEGTFNEVVEKLVNTMSKSSGLKTFINVQDAANHLSTNIQLAFYRILQEQLNNVIKYANASSLFISIRAMPDDVILTIKDDGKGFDTSVPKDGIGLVNIKRRATVLGGQARVISSPGTGCEVIVRIPKSD